MNKKAEGDGTCRSVQEEWETGSFFLSLSVLLAAVIFATKRPFPPLPAIAAKMLALALGGVTRLVTWRAAWTIFLGQLG